MGDILQRLRDRAAIQNATGGYPLDKPNLSSKAADEIARLSAALQSIADNTCCDGCREAGRVAALALKEE
jgi:hypothetical protein